jgi:hypothetical protein
MDPRLSREEMAKELVERAEALWGKERAETLRPFLELVAGHLWQLSLELPHPEEEPAFFWD